MQDSCVHDSGVQDGAGSSGCMDAAMPQAAAAQAELREAGVASELAELVPSRWWHSSDGGEITVFRGASRYSMHGCMGLGKV